MNVLRASLALVIAASSVAFLAAAADASCIAPRSVKETADRADVVVYGRVSQLEGPPGVPSRFALFSVERVLKGSASSRIGVALGPNVGGGAPAGPVAATSVDYMVQAGSDHTLYLRRAGQAGYETDACSGSHSGAPTADETAFFGTGSAPEAAPAGITGASANDRLIAAVATAAAVLLGILAIVYAQRSARPEAAA